jgi:aquaporin Z
MNKYLAEFIATCIFVYVIISTGNPVAIGATLALMILAIRNISGAHLNPAVSLVMASVGKIEIDQLIPYVLSQLLGGLVALEIYKRYRM